MIGVYQQEKVDHFPIVNDVMKRHLNQNTHDAGSFTLPPDAYDPLRQQYDVIRILNHIARKNRSRFNLRLGLVDVDIYSQGMNFIFGLADPLRKTAIVSTYRLTGEKKNERIAKECVHEIGHLLGLAHCSNSKCVMHFSNTVADTDNKTINFCTSCRSKIE